MEISKNDNMKKLLVPKKGDYWKMLDGALGRVVLKPMKTLDSVFMHDDVKHILNAMCPDQASRDGRTMAFAFGDTVP